MICCQAGVLNCAHARISRTLQGLLVPALGRMLAGPPPAAAAALECAPACSPAHLSASKGQPWRRRWRRVARHVSAAAPAIAGTQHGSTTAAVQQPHAAPASAPSRPVRPALLRAQHRQVCARMASGKVAFNLPPLMMLPSLTATTQQQDAVHTSCQSDTGSDFMSLAACLQSSML
jgi:hypothetical protein